MSRRSGVPVDRYVSAALFDAIRASGQSTQAIAVAVASSLGYSAKTVEKMLAPGHRLPVRSGPVIVAAVCELINFPTDQALTTMPPINPSDEIERRFAAARARVRAEQWRLSPEDCQARRGSPFGRPDADDEAA